MKKHLIALLVITPLLLSSQASTSYAAAKAGAKCSKVGSKSVVGSKTFTCIKSRSQLIWDKGVKVVAVSTSFCLDPGQIITKSEKQFSCRYISGRKSIWFQVSGNNDAPLSAINNSKVETCKIQDLRSNKFIGNGNVGFPMTTNAIKPNGLIKVAVLPVNFPDSPKVKSPSSYWKPFSDLIDQRNAYLYDNRIKYEWTIPSEWLMMAKGAEFFASYHETVQPDGSRKSDGVKQILSTEEQTSSIFSEAEKYLKIEDYDFFWLFTNPLEKRVPQGPAFGRFQEVKTTKTLYTGLNFYSYGNRVFSGAYHLGPIGTLQDSVAHEMAHFHGMIQHAPGNGWGWYVSNNPTWESWIAGWRPDTQYVCLDATQPWKEAQFHLSAIDLNSQGFKSGVIKISDSQVLVVESRRPGPFTTALPKSISGITVYIVDTTKSGERWDGNFDKELDYYMVFLRNDGRNYPIQKSQNLAVWDENIIAYQGDSFSYKNIKVTLMKSGDFDTVLVSKS